MPQDSQSGNLKAQALQPAGLPADPVVAEQRPPGQRGCKGRDHEGQRRHHAMVPPPGHVGHHHQPGRKPPSRTQARATTRPMIMVFASGPPNRFGASRPTRTSAQAPALAGRRVNSTVDTSGQHDQHRQRDKHHGLQHHALRQHQPAAGKGRLLVQDWPLPFPDPFQNEDGQAWGETGRRSKAARSALLQRQDQIAHRGPCRAVRAGSIAQALNSASGTASGCGTCRTRVA